jgi:hypothetical protein
MTWMKMVDECLTLSVEIEDMGATILRTIDGF